MNTRSFYDGGLRLSVLSPADRSGLPPHQYEAAIAEVQRLRGAVYLRDGAIPAEVLDPDGRHRADCDHTSYHLLMHCPAGHLQACLRVQFHQLPLRTASLSAIDYLTRMPPEVAGVYSRAIHEFASTAHQGSSSFGEVGGWAVAEPHRKTPPAIALPLAVWALYNVLGHGRAIAFATDRHTSAGMLRRIGGWPLTLEGSPLPDFFDPHYVCPLHLMGFESQRLAPQYRAIVADMTEHIKLQVGQTTNGIRWC